MFTGIVQTIGQIAAREDRPGGDARLRIASPGLAAESLSVGDSISVSGACLTATALEKDGFWADVSAETLGCTTLGNSTEGTSVNLEPALKLNDSLGGHLVSGHVDAVGRLLSIRDEARSKRLRFGFPPELAGYIAAKGSICVDGISLTVNDVAEEDFGVNIVPHTLAVTTLGDRAIGDEVNLEVDQVARYLERLLDARQTATHSSVSNELG